MLKRSTPSISHPMVLCMREKHGNQYFYIPNEETLFRIANKIVSDRNIEGWYNNADEDEQLLLAQRAEGDLKAAWNLLKQRKDYEYEGFDLESFTQV